MKKSCPPKTKVENVEVMLYLVGPLVLIGIGVIVLVKALFFREG